MKKIALLIISISICLTSCNKDDVGGSSSDKIIGTWGNYKDTYIDENGDIVTEMYDPYYEKDVFSADGKGTGYLYDSDCKCFSNVGFQATWENLGGGNYKFSVLGFIVTHKVSFIGDNDMTFETADKEVYYYRRME